MLYAGRVQLRKWDQRSAPGVALYIQESMHGLRRLQVVDVPVLEERLRSGAFFLRLLIVSTAMGRLRRAVRGARVGLSACW